MFICIFQILLFITGTLARSGNVPYRPNNVNNGLLALNNNNNNNDGSDVATAGSAAVSGSVLFLPSSLISSYTADTESQYNTGDESSDLSQFLNGGGLQTALQKTTTGTDDLFGCAATSVVLEEAYSSDRQKELETTLSTTSVVPLSSTSITTSQSSVTSASSSSTSSMPNDPEYSKQISAVSKSLARGSTYKGAGSALAPGISILLSALVSLLT